LNSNFYTPQDPGFKQLVQSIWQVNQVSVFNKEYIIPKGVVEIIFNFSDGAPILAHLGKTITTLPHCFINGFNSSPVEIQLPRQQVFFGVVLQPLAVKKILKHPAGSFADLTVDLSLLNPVFNSLWQQLAAQGDFNKRVSIFLNWLQEYCRQYEPQERLLDHFLYAADQHTLSIKQLSSTLCYSPRHISRKITEATGMNTETFLLYKKYLHAVQLMQHSNLSLTAIAYQSHFSDQSHFIRSFKAYTKMTPKEYQRTKSLVKCHIYKDVR
jgi:AraC-like DNA-binding protein